jgi:hypothetical protein
MFIFFFIFGDQEEIFLELANRHGDAESIEAAGELAKIMRGLKGDSAVNNEIGNMKGSICINPEVMELSELGLDFNAMFKERELRGELRGERKGEILGRIGSAINLIRMDFPREVIAEAEGLPLSFVEGLNAFSSAGGAYDTYMLGLFGEALGILNGGGGMDEACVRTGLSRALVERLKDSPGAPGEGEEFEECKKIAWE